MTRLPLGGVPVPPRLPPCGARSASPGDDTYSSATWFDRTLLELGRLAGRVGEQLVHDLPAPVDPRQRPVVHERNGPPGPPFGHCRQRCIAGLVDREDA